MRDNDIFDIAALASSINGPESTVSGTGVIESYITGEPGLSCVAEIDGKTVGFILGRQSYTPSPDIESAWVQLIGVDPGYRRLGIAKSLLDTFCRRCSERGVKTIHVSVPANNGDFQFFLRDSGFEAGEWIHFTRTI